MTDDGRAASEATKKHRDQKIKIGRVSSNGTKSKSTQLSSKSNHSSMSINHEPYREDPNAAAPSCS